MAKRVALITTWYPPQQSIATQRMLAMAEYLSERYEVTVFALDRSEHIVQKESIEVRYHRTYTFTEILKSNTADHAFVHKAKTALRLVIGKFIKSPLKRWKETTQADFLRQHQQHPFDLVISSYAPAEAHEVVLHVKKQYPNLPWIADMRDEMSANPYLTIEDKNKLRTLELEVNEHAQALLAVSKPIVQQFEALCPKVPKHVEIRNGFNHRFQRENTSSTRSDVFKIGYFGTFYGSIKPSYFFEALAALDATGDLSNFEVHLVGVHSNFQIPKSLNTRVFIHERMPYEQAIRTMSTMDANLLLHPRNNRKGVYTGKLFDYISVQVPVIAMIDSTDVAADLLREFNCGYIGEFDQVEQNKSTLLSAYSDWKNGITRAASNDQVASLHREKQMEKVAQLIEELCA